MSRGGAKALVLVLAAGVIVIAVVLAVVWVRKNSAQTPQDGPQAPSAKTMAEAAPAPEPPDGEIEAQVELLLSEMTLWEKVCQMMLTRPAAVAENASPTGAGEALRLGLERYPVGGLFYNKSNLSDWEQTKRMLAATQTYSKIPLILTCDEEGGRVSRLMSTLGTTRVDAMLTYQNDGGDTAWKNAHTIAADMSALGFNMDLAPVADVWSNPENTVIGDRAYSDDFTQAAQLIPWAVRGFHNGGVACVLKHFPGHGGTTADSHYGSAYVYRTLEELRAGELLPFQAGIDAGADAVMMGHLIVPAVSGEPAVFCYELVTELLREEMGFQGVVMTDALEMRAISDHYGDGEAARGAVRAGVDMLLCPNDLDAAIQALVDAVNSGEIPESRIDESVTRILRLKLSRGILPMSGS